MNNVSKFGLFFYLVLLVSGILSTSISQPKDVPQVKIINVSDLEEIINQSEDRPLLINV